MVQFGEWYVICLPGSILIVFQAGVISEWANDGKRFLLEHFDTIKTLPPTSTILLSHFLLPLLGFTSTILQRSHLW
jgi:hypothetical protein